MNRRFVLTFVLLAVIRGEFDVRNVHGGGLTHSFETLNGNIYVRKGTSERGDDDA